MVRRALTLLAALLVVTVTPALAQYRIGMSAAITGPASSTYAPTYEAYKAYFKRVNDAGGINGQKVEIAYEDDRGEPQRAAANAKKWAIIGAIVGPIVSVIFVVIYIAFIAAVVVHDLPSTTTTTYSGY